MRWLVGQGVPVPGLTVLALLLSMGCTAEGEDVATGFGDPTASPMTTPMIPSDGTEGTGGTGDTGDSADTTSASTSPASTSDGTTTGASETADPSAGSTTGPVEQPDSGMYSACESAADCVGLNACVIPDGGSVGYCTRTPCTDPGVDCDPSPGGTASPTCVDAPVGAGTSAVCALGCDAGETCPSPMQCQSVGTSSICV